MNIILRFHGGPTPGQIVTECNWPPPDELIDIETGGKYIKTNQSQITDEQIEKMSHVMRGAEYEWRQ